MVRLIVSPGTRPVRLTIAVVPRSVVIATLPDGVGVGEGVAVGAGGAGMNGLKGGVVGAAVGDGAGVGDAGEVLDDGGGVVAAGADGGVATAGC